MVAGNGYHLYLHTLQPDLGVMVAIRVWNGPQRPPEDAEGWTAVVLESETGDVVVSRLRLT